MKFTIDIYENKLLCMLVSFLLALEGIGFYFLIQSFLDPQSTELSAINSILGSWTSSLSTFERLNVTVSPNISLQATSLEDWGSNLNNFPKYTHFFYSCILSANALLSSNSLNSSSLHEYNITTNITLIIKGINSTIINELPNVPIHSSKKTAKTMKTCINHSLGTWDSLSLACYYYYNTIKICIVVDDSFSLVKWYQKGCDNNGYIKQIETRQPTSSFLGRNQKIEIEVRNEEDPFVYASYNGLSRFSSTSNQYKIAGGSILAFASIPLLIILFPNLCKRRKIEFDIFQNEDSRLKNK